MSNFERTPCRTNIVPLRPSPELEARIVRERMQRDDALDRFHASERRITARLGRVLTGVRETAVRAWHRWGF